MEKYEVLAPVGGKSAFYTAIKAGADAVYMGLNKFNARMRADNISIEELSELVKYAHIKGVAVYITLNTLVDDKEMKEVVLLVGKCIESKVDAFIVQDYGIVGVLRRVYPGIVLHGSTQMGVHNRYGAMVAKELGLSRIVLSREVTIDDIKDIKDNVDIELEVFVQGAMCVAFSGNCYLSSLKHNASGNRGECKQLCRLPYRINNKSGYFLSPRDNCMLDYISALCEIGVKSFKIEGRLKRDGYVSTMTSVYRDSIDSYIAGQQFDIDANKNILKRVFARGEYISGYFDNNDIIDSSTNKHRGILIGKVVACERFKDIYRYTLDLDCGIVSGDGLTIVSGEEECTLGVGNIDNNGSKYVVYGKNIIKPKSDVYLTVDSRLESREIDLSRKLHINIVVKAMVNKPIEVEIECDGVIVNVTGEICQEAKSQPVTEDVLIKQLSKVDKDMFVVDNINIDICEKVFLTLGAINAIRRQGIEELLTKLLRRDFESERKEIVSRDFDAESIALKQEGSCEYSRIAIVDESCNVKSLVNNYDSLILSPTNYSLAIIDKFINNYYKYFANKLYINLPIIAMKDDLLLIEDIVDKYSDKVMFVANNIYALAFAGRCHIMVGSGLNITNHYAIGSLASLGVKEFVSSVEKWCPTLSGTYKINNSKMVLMTMAHCPNKTLTKCDCSKCKHSGDISIIGSGGNYNIRRYKLHNCYFELVDNMPFKGKDRDNQIEDLR